MKETAQMDPCGAATFAPGFAIMPALPSSTDTGVVPSGNSVLNARLAILLATSAQGNVLAFEDFYVATVRLARAMVMRIAGSNHADDVLSEAYFQAWRQAALFDVERASAITWLLAICRSRALDRLRLERTQHAGLSGAPEAPEDDIRVCPLPGPDALLESTQSCQRLNHALTELSGPERWVLALAYYRDLSHTEIAGITEFPLGTVKTLIRRAQQKLGKLVVIGVSATTVPS